MCVSCTEHARSSSTEAAAAIFTGVLIGAGVLAYVVMTAIWPYLLAAYLTLAVVALPSPRVRHAVVRGAVRGVRWSWRHRSASARARTAAVEGHREHQAVTGGDTPALTGAADVAAIEAKLATLVHQTERPAIRASSWRAD